MNIVTSKSLVAADMRKSLINKETCLGEPQGKSLKSFKRFISGNINIISMNSGSHVYAYLAT